MAIVIRELLLSDRPHWDVLWQGYLTFYNANIPASVTQTIWSRFLDPAQPIHCLVAEDEGKLLGIAHYLFHLNTWMTEPVCYLEDLFTSAPARGQGVGRKLIEAVYEKAKTAGSTRIYWTTHETNTQAMILYDKVASKPGFVQYRKEF